MPADLPGWLREEAQKLRERGGPPRGGEAVAIIAEHYARVAEEMLAAEVARVRADVAEDLARVIERRAAEYDGAPRFVLNDLAEDLRQGRLAPAESVVGAPTPISAPSDVDAPRDALTDQDFDDLRADVADARDSRCPSRIAHRTGVVIRCFYYRGHTEDRAVVAPLHEAAGTAWRDGDDREVVGALPEDEGTRQERLINVDE